MGHPLLLRVFADAVKRRALAVHFGNAAEKVAEAMGLAAPIAFRDKLVRVVDWYRAQFSEQERAIIEAVAVFGGTATIHRIRAYLRQRKGPPSSVAEAAVASQIEALLAAGILQFDDKGAHRYGCHPILRERFQPDQAGTRSAAAISLYSRPAPLRPRTLAEAEPYLDAIRIHTNAGAFKEAAIILGRHLDSGDVLYDFVGGYRALLDGLLGFLRRDRRNACEAQLGRGWLIAMVPRIVMAGIALYEWEIADDYARWDAALTAQDPNIKRSLNFSLRASIAAEIGAADDARALYEAAIATADPGSRGALMLERAELERALGAPRESLRLLGEWMEVDQPFASWIIGWPVALETLGSIFKRTHPAFAQRCAKAWEIARTAIVSDALQIDSNYFAEYLRLDMIVRADRTERDWQRLLELANLMERHHKIYATKSLGSWPIGRVIALNGLGRTDEAVKLAWSSIHQLHGHSWRRLWLRTEIARARLLQGHMRGGQDDACNIIHTARMRQRYLIARDAAELVVEHGGTPETDRIREAQRMLGEFNERMQLAEADIPHLGPLPGEPGWDERVTLRLLREVRAEEQNGPATQEELDAALVLAAEIGISSAIVELLRLGASPRAAREGGKSALRVAIEHGHRQAVETMLDASSEPVDLESQRDVEAITAAVASSHSDILKRLLDGCVTMEPDHLAAILAAAATVSSGETIRVLCGAGADPGRLCEDQHPLVRAARTGNLGAVEVLAECIGDINKAADADGETALMAAMAAGREPVIIWLVDRSARLDARDNSGRTAIDYAVLRGRVQALELLAAVTGRDVFADVDPTRLAVGASYHGEAGELRRAVEHGAQLDQLSPQGETALVAAAARGHLDVIRVIRELAPDISIDTQDRGGVTGLMAAAGNGADAIVTALVREFGARFDMTDAENRDAMMYALIRNQPDTINLLSSLGASPRNTRETFAAMVGAAAANNRSALVAFLTAVAKAGWINTFAEEAHGLDVIANALIAQVRRVAGSKLVLPTRLPEELTDSDLEAQPCAVLQAGSSTYAGLPLAAAPQTLIDRFTGAAASKIANIDEFDADRMRIAEAPWLGGLLALLPHRENRIEVPFFVTDDSVILAGRTNEWIYEAMSGRPPPQCDDNLLAHVRFFFATVIGRLGAFHFAERMDDAIWLPDASEDVKREFAEKLQSLHIIGTAEDGRQELRVTVVFKNALFVTSVMVAPDWVMELANEDLLMEELPIAFGQRIDLLVRR
jgi:ankyrin repeat protein